MNKDCTERRDFLKVAVRAFPAAVAGKIVSFSFDRTSKRFELVFEENGSKSEVTEIMAPRILFGSGVRVQSTDEKGSWRFVFAPDEQMVRVWSDRGERRHRLVISPDTG